MLKKSRVWESWLVGSRAIDRGYRSREEKLRYMVISMEVDITRQWPGECKFLYEYLRNVQGKYVSLSGINRIAQASHAYSGPFLRLPAWTEHAGEGAEVKNEVVTLRPRPTPEGWLIGKDPDAGKDWGQEKRVTENEMVGWHHRINGHEFEQTPGDSEGQGSLACCNLCGCKESDTMKNNATRIAELKQRKGISKRI